MAGSLYLGCGSAEDEAPLWRSMLHRPSTRIVYWPFALPPTMISSADQWLRAGLDALGVTYQLDTWTRLDHHRPSELTRHTVDLLFVGGGNTFRLLDVVRTCGFVEPVREFWQDGGDYYGGSAGAVLACETIEIAVGHDPNEGGLQDLAALGLVTGVAILPHFTDPQVGASRLWASEHVTEVLGLPESVGLRCVGGRATVLGAGQLSRISADALEHVQPGESFDLPTR